MSTQLLKNKHAGFTLVELLVAISVLSLSILAAFSAVSNNLKGINFSQDQITAYYLADEGIEYIRNVRDQNDIQNQHDIALGSGSVNWLAGIAATPSDPCYSTACTVDSPLASISACPSSAASSCKALWMNQSSGLFGYTTSGGWAQTQFQRGITVTVDSPTEAIVTSTVIWNTNGVSKTYTLSEVMRAWQ